ncbi:MAG: glutamate 5-kinase [Candidatus Paceibacterota bacterium]
MRLVIKIGTQVISSRTGLDTRQVGNIINDISKLFKLGHEIIIVSSGAIAAGLPELKFKSKLEKKVAAAVGQPLLIQSYIKEAKKHKITVGQILILSDDFTNHLHFKNFLLNIEEMLKHKILPIINENDVMKRVDLRVNDNDALGAMVAVGVRADKLIILTNQQGLFTKNPDHDKKAKLIKQVDIINSKIKALCLNKSQLGVGGMLAKVNAAEYATKRGIETLIGNGRKKGIINEATSENFSGTRFIARHKNK